MDFRHIKNINSRQLDRALLREGKTVTDVYANQSYTVLFQQSGSVSMTQEKVKIYYKQDVPINKGRILKYRDTFYMVMNRNDIESEVFYSSLCVRCNATWNIEGTNLHIVSSTLSSPNAMTTNTISLINGKISVQTSDIDFLHNKFNVDEQIFAFGGIYQLENKFFIDGISFLTFTREMLGTGTDIIHYDGDKVVNVGTYTLNPYVTHGSIYITDAPITFTSSNEDIATCNGSQVNFLSVGTVDITMASKGYIENGKYPTEYNVAITVTFTVQ